jgi:ankyrin repeat protein
MKNGGRFLLFGLFLALTVGPLPAAEIHEAARAGDLAKVKALIEKDPGLVRAPDSTGSTPLHLAAMGGHLDVAGFLIDKGAPIDPKDGMGRTPLWWGVSSRNVGLAKRLIEAGADINSEDGDRWTPLMNAAFRGSREMVDFLLERNPLLPPIDDQRDQRIYMLQTFAADKSLVRLMERLMAGGANYRWKDEAGSLMHKAAAGGSPEIIASLAKAGQPAAEANAFGWTPLHYAAEKGQTKAVEMLLTQGAPIDARTKDGKTAYNLAREWAMKDAADLLASKGADRSEPKFPALSGPYLGQTPPGKVPEPFALGIVASKYSFHSSVVFTPDGKTAYWSVQDYGGTMASLETHQDNGRWTLPGMASFGRLGRSDDVPFISPDGRKLFIVSNRPLEKNGRGDKENIWVMERKDGGWSEPKPLPPVVNSISLHWQVSVDAQGNLYFGGHVEGDSLGVSDIYRSKFENGQYAKPENLGPAINGPGYNHSPFVAPDGSYLIFSKSNPQARVDSLHISFLKKDGTWTRARELNSVMGYRTRSMCPWVTPDGKYLFFDGILANENQPFWVEASFIDDLRKIELLPSAAALIEATLDKEGGAAAQAKFKELRSQADRYGFEERAFNALGYKQLQNGKVPEAIIVQQMGVELFPDSWNAYDSLAEACLYGGDLARSEANYRLSLAKNPRNENARRILGRFDMDRKYATLKAGQPTGLKGSYFGQTPPEKTAQLFAPGLINVLGSSAYAPTFSPDGKEMYFTRDLAGQPQVIMVCREGADGWTAPAPAAFSAGFSAHEPHLTRDNRRIYWGWFRPVPAGEPKPPTGDIGLYVAERTTAGWSAAQYVGQGMFVSSTRDGQIYVTDTSEAPQGNAYLAKAVMENGRIAKLERLQGGIARFRERVKWIAHPCLAPDGSYILFDNGNGMMQVSFRDAKGEWGEAIDLTRRGLDRNGGIASITSDGRYLFYRSGSDLYWVSTAVIEDARPRTEK